MDQKIVINQVVLLNLSSHFTLTQIQKKKSSKRIVGALIGKQVDRNLFLSGSFEAPFSDSRPKMVDIEFMQKKTLMYKAITYYKETELLGWYSITSDEKPSKKDFQVYEKIRMYCENPICLLLNPNPKVAMSVANELAVKLFEMKGGEFK